MREERAPDQPPAMPGPAFRRCALRYSPYACDPTAGGRDGLSVIGVRPSQIRHDMVNEGDGFASKVLSTAIVREPLRSLDLRGKFVVFLIMFRS